MDFKGTKGLKILNSNEIGFGLGDNEHNTRITFWGVDSETKANILMMLKAPEMLEMLNRFMEITRELNHPRLDHLRGSANKLFKEVTEIN